MSQDSHTFDMHFHVLASHQFTSITFFIDTHPTILLDNLGVDTEYNVEVEYGEGNEVGVKENIVGGCGYAGYNVCSRCPSI
jgi:hypothetical protein